MAQRIRVGNPDWESVFRQAKLSPKKRKKGRLFMFKEFSVGLETSPGSLNVLCMVLIKKNIEKRRSGSAFGSGVDPD